MSRVWFAALIPLLFVACLPEQPEPAPIATASPEAGATPMVANPGDEFADADLEVLVAELLKMSETPDDFELTPRPYAICDAVMARDPLSLAPFVALLDSPEASGRARLFVLRCLDGIMKPEFLPQLEGMLDSEDWTTRSCAVTLIGSIRDEKSVEILKPLYGDEDERIAFAALSGLAIQVGDPYRQELADLYLEKDTSDAWRSEIARVLLMDPQPSDREVLEAILLNGDTEPQGRDLVTMVLANIGSPESIPALRASLDLDDRESFQNIASAAIQFIEEKVPAAEESAPPVE